VQAQRYLGEGYGWVVDLDLEKFFDRVNQDKLMSLVKERVADRRVLKLIDRYLKAGTLTEEGWEATVEGTPQGGPLTPPTILQTFFFGAEISRTWLDPEDHRDSVMGHFHALHQGTDHLASAGPVRFLQTVLHLRGKVFESPDDQLQFRLPDCFIRELAGLFLQSGHTLSELRDAWLELALFNQPLGVTVDHPCQALPQLAPLPLHRGQVMAPGVRVRVRPAAVFFCQAIGMRQQPTDLAPHGEIQQSSPHLRIPTDALAAKAVRVRPQAPVIGVVTRFALGSLVADALAIIRIPHPWQLTRPCSRYLAPRRYCRAWR
jgi:Reverse transcriptase (RNA-dependent DNA polymerase)